MNTQFPVVRPSQRIRNVATAQRLSGVRGDYPTNADTLEEIAAAVAENEEAQATQAARVAELEKAMSYALKLLDADHIDSAAAVLQLTLEKGAK